VLTGPSLFNPAFCTLLLAKTTAHYLKQSGQGLPYPFAFLILPIALHPATRNILPGTTNAVMLNWLTENAELLSDFPERASRMSQITKEAILFALTHEKLSLSQGRILLGAHKYSTTAALSHSTDDSESCLRTAAFLGRWLTQNGTVASTLSSWGLRP
jgi:hypothetical protein